MSVVWFGLRVSEPVAIYVVSQSLYGFCCGHTARWNRTLLGRIQGISANYVIIALNQSSRLIYWNSEIHGLTTSSHRGPI